MGQMYESQLAQVCVAQGSPSLTHCKRLPSSIFCRQTSPQGLPPLYPSPGKKVPETTDFISRWGWRWNCLSPGTADMAEVRKQSRASESSTDPPSKQQPPSLLLPWKYSSGPEKHSSNPHPTTYLLSTLPRAPALPISEPNLYN